MNHTCLNDDTCIYLTFEELHELEADQFCLEHFQQFVQKNAVRQVLVGQRFGIRIVEIVKLNYCMQCFEKYEELKQANNIDELRVFLEANSKKGAETVQSKKARAIVEEFDRVSEAIYKAFQHFV